MGRFSRSSTVALLALALAAGCGRAGPTAPMDRDAFIEVMTELRLAAREFKDPSAFDARKADILAAAGVTDSTLMQFVRVYREDPEFMSLIWEEVDERLNPPPFERDTATVR
ncbi:MAG: hypothetical protein ACREL7_13760 [Longimicrobiales bacterium]